MISKQILVFILFISTSLAFSQFKYQKQVDSIFSEWNTKQTPGCALGIFKNGKIAYTKGYGLANLEYDIPITENSVFRIASTSKQFTAACIVLLSEKDELSLDDNLKSFFPDFPDYAKKITVRHLLNHTSGIRDYLQLSALKGLDDFDYYTDDDIMKWLVNQTSLNFEPGDDFIYSNSGYWLLGQIVNKVSGQNMADFADKEIFEPLGMTSTHFHNDHTKIVKNRASGYSPRAENVYKISMTTLDMIGDGGIFTTINDMKKWDDAYYNSETLSPSFWDIMTTTGQLNDGEKIDYAAGLFLEEYKGLNTISHGGAFVGFRAEYLKFPDEKTSIIIFANRADANPSKKAFEVADIILKNKLKEDSPKKEKQKQTNEDNYETPVVEFSLEQMTGEYEIQPGVVASITIKNDSLHVLQNWNGSRYSIAKIKGNTYQIPGDSSIDFIFEKLENDKTQVMKVNQNGNMTITKRKEVINISNNNIEEYEGSYYSKELDAYYNLDLKDGKLYLTVDDNLDAMTCELDQIDRLILPLGIITFQRLENKISGFNLDSGRVKNLFFGRVK